jgi:hypothetical protein
MDFSCCKKFEDKHFLKSFIKVQSVKKKNVQFEVCSERTWFQTEKNPFSKQMIFLLLFEKLFLVR